MCHEASFNICEQFLCGVLFLKCLTILLSMELRLKKHEIDVIIQQGLPSLQSSFFSEPLGW